MIEKRKDEVMMDQKSVFLNGEADAFFQRNRKQMEENKGIYPWVELLTDYKEYGRNE